MHGAWMTPEGVIQLKSHWERDDLGGSRPKGDLHAWHVANRALPGRMALGVGCMS